MTARNLTQTEYNGLKTAARSLIKSAGGVESATSITRIKKSVMSDYQNIDKPEYFMPIDVAADLERDTNQPFITAALARLSNQVLIPMPPVVACKSTFVSQLSVIGKEMGDIFAKASSALADGSLSERDKAEVIEQIREGITALCTAKSILEGGGE